MRKRTVSNQPSLLLALALQAILVQPSVADAAERTGAVLGEKTPWATLYYVQDSGLAGPTVMIVGGLHGNELAGTVAANQIRHWPISRGKIVVLPRANAAALQANSRYTPDVERSERNLNRNFPRKDKQEPARGTLAQAIWRLVQDHKPTWLLDLQEGYDFRQVNPKSVGSSVIVHPHDETNAAAVEMLATINKTITEEHKQFVRLRFPINSGLARAAAEHLGARAMTLETTTKDQPVSLRARQHRILVHSCLLGLKMLDDSVTADLITDRRRDTDRIDVAVYDAGGTFGNGVPRILELLGSSGDFTAERVGAADIRAGVLQQFDVAIFSGGSGSKQSAALGDVGRKKVKHFVDEGGGYVGICAGSFLACHGFSWGLKVLDAKTVSRKWRRGVGTVKVEMTPLGNAMLGDRPGPFDMRYANGPIIEPSLSDALSDYQTLAIYRTELAENGTPKGAMTNSPAAVAGRCGKGSVICFSGHPEQTKGLESLVHRAVTWTARGGD